jgi:hypothetical protein
VIDPHTQAVLQEIVRRESRSLLSYMADAYPWTTVAGSRALTTLRQVIHDESEAVAELGRYLVRQKAPVPFLGSYPAGFTTCNFISLEFLLPRLLTAQQDLITVLEADLGRLPPGESRAQVEALLAVKRKDLATLQTLAVPRPAPASA